MDTMLIDDVPSERLDQLIARANLRLAWRLRFSDFLHGHLTLASTPNYKLSASESLAHAGRRQ
jgi:hypothetical protein